MVIASRATRPTHYPMKRANTRTLRPRVHHRSEVGNNVERRFVPAQQRNPRHAPAQPHGTPSPAISTPITPAGSADVSISPSESSYPLPSGHSTSSTGSTSSTDSDDGRCCLFEDGTDEGPPTAAAFTLTEVVSSKYTFERNEDGELIGLGNGAFGQVVKALSKEEGYNVAVKLVKKTESAMAEVEIMGELDHPCIAKLYECIVTPDAIYIVMELGPGTDLQSHIEEVLVDAGMPEAETTLIFRRILEALAHMDTKDIRHRDIKPGNILYNILTGEVMVVDFGTSTKCAKGETMHDNVGTRVYKAGQFFVNQNDDDNDTVTFGPGCDMAALGFTASHLLSGGHKMPKVRRDGDASDIPNRNPSDMKEGSFISYPFMAIITCTVRFDEDARLDIHTAMKHVTQEGTIITGWVKPDDAASFHKETSLQIELSRRAAEVGKVDAAMEHITTAKTVYDAEKKRRNSKAQDDNDGVEIGCTFASLHVRAGNYTAALEEYEYALGYTSDADCEKDIKARMTAARAMESGTQGARDRSCIARIVRLVDPLQAEELLFLNVAEGYDQCPPADLKALVSLLRKRGDYDVAAKVSVGAIDVAASAAALFRGLLKKNNKRLPLESPILEKPRPANELQSEEMERKLDELEDFKSYSPLYGNEDEDEEGDDDGDDDDDDGSGDDDDDGGDDDGSDDDGDDDTESVEDDDEVDEDEDDENDEEEQSAAATRLEKKVSALEEENARLRTQVKKGRGSISKVPKRTLPILSQAQITKIRNVVNAMIGGPSDAMIARVITLYVFAANFNHLPTYEELRKIGIYHFADLFTPRRKNCNWGDSFLMCEEIASLNGFDGSKKVPDERSRDESLQFLPVNDLIAYRRSNKAMRTQLLYVLKKFGGDADLLDEKFPAPPRASKKKAAPKKARKRKADPKRARKKKAGPKGARKKKADV